MKKGTNVIVINGKRYDAHTGESLDAGHSRTEHESASKAAPEAARRSVPQHGPADRKSDRTPATHMAPHTPEHARTLMRRAVKRPDDGLKRHIKVQGRLVGSTGPSSSKILTRTSARQPNTGRLQNPATKRGNGRLISHFSPELFSVDAHTPAITYGAAPVRRAAGSVPAHQAPAKPALTTDDILEYAVQHASDPQPAPVRRKHKPFLRRQHAKQR